MDPSRSTTCVDAAGQDFVPPLDVSGHEEGAARVDRDHLHGTVGNDTAPRLQCRVPWRSNAGPTPHSSPIYRSSISLNENERVSLAAQLEEVQVPEGQVLFNYGEPGDCLYVIRSGKAEVFFKDDTGTRIVLEDRRNGRRGRRAVAPGRRAAHRIRRGHGGAGRAPPGPGRPRSVPAQPPRGRHRPAEHAGGGGCASRGAPAAHGFAQRQRRSGGQADGRAEDCGLDRGLQREHPLSHDPRRLFAVSDRSSTYRWCPSRRCSIRSLRPADHGRALECHLPVRLRTAQPEPPGGQRPDPRRHRIRGQHQAPRWRSRTSTRRSTS